MVRQVLKPVPDASRLARAVVEQSRSTEAEDRLTVLTRTPLPGLPHCLTRAEQPEPDGVGATTETGTEPPERPTLVVEADGFGELVVGKTLATHLDSLIAEEKQHRSLA